LLIHLLKNGLIENALVFTRTKHGADKAVKVLHKEQITAAAIHGNKRKICPSKMLCLVLKMG
jgi:ATP-dependent RNA helicase RhlE